MVELITKDGNIYIVSDEYIIGLKSDYGEFINVDIELAKMRNWLEANPARRKTERGMKRFVTSWLARAVDSVQLHDRDRVSSAQAVEPQPTRPTSFDPNEFFDLAVAYSYKVMAKSAGGIR